MDDYVVARLSTSHVLDGFECAHDALTAWLKQSARTADNKGIARVWVYTMQSSEAVVGYFALSPHLVKRDGDSKLMRGDPDEIPAILLGKLAVDNQLRGKGHGGELLHAALTLCVQAVDRAGGRYVVVDAIDDEAQSFYEHYGFTAMPSAELRLIRKASAIKADLGL